MRLNNRNKAGFYNFLSTFLLMLFLGGVLVFFLEKYKFDVLGIKSALFILIPAIFSGHFLRERKANF